MHKKRHFVGFLRKSELLNAGVREKGGEPGGSELQGESVKKNESR
jgi:hypothetical protein